MKAMFPGSLAVSRRFETIFIELEDRMPAPLDGALVTGYAAEQPGTPACALRIESGGRPIVYSGDTAWSDDLVEATRGADVFICEAYFFSKQVPYTTSTTRPCANTARALTASASSSPIWAPTCSPTSIGQPSSALTMA